MCEGFMTFLDTRYLSGLDGRQLTLVAEFNFIGIVLFNKLPIESRVQQQHVCYQNGRNRASEHTGNN